METIQDFLSSNGIQESELTLDGTFKELKTNNFKGWYVGDNLGDGKRSITIEDWRTRDRKTFVEGMDLGDPAERAKLEEIRLRYEKEKLDLQLLKQGFAQDRVAGFQKEKWTTPSKYLTAKKITEVFGALLVESRVETTDLIIPMCDSGGAIWNYQTIQDSGAKAFVPGALVDGLSFTLCGPFPATADEVLISEGFATASSIKMAMGHATVVCAFSANNLLLVAESIRAKYPHAKILICGDDDSKKEINAGVLKAEAAAKACAGNFVLPVFKTIRGKTDSDFNDLHQRYSLDTVAEQIGKALSATKPPSADFTKHFSEATKLTDSPKKIDQLKSISHQRIAKSIHANQAYVNGLTTMDLEVGKNGAIKLPPEQEVADELLKYYSSRAVINEGAIFLYQDNHWVECSEYEEGKIIQQVNILCARLATDSKMIHIFNIFKRGLLKPDRNLFDPHLTAVNFLNGTLHIKQKAEKWSLEFKDHNPLDFCTNVIPIIFDKARSNRNKEFEAMLLRVLGDTEDGREKWKAIRQMYGACLIPYFPHLFMIHGPGGSGKSSLIIPALRLLGENNWSSVEPHDFDGFNMETMVGKLANIVLDINTHDPMKDHQLKKIEDSVKVRVRRKGKVDAIGYLPRIHIFGGNEIPPTFDKGSGAHIRRWTFLRVEGFKAEGNYSKNFANEVFDQNPVGILNFALDGLEEVLNANGHYLNPESGKRDMLAWTSENDSIAQFIEDIFKGTETIEIDSGGRLPKKDSWAQFKFWHIESYERKATIGKIKFYRFFEKALGGKLEAEKFRLVASKGVDYYAGLRLKNDGVSNPGM